MSLVAGLRLFGNPVCAQDDGQASIELQELNSHQELNLNEDKTLLIETDSKQLKATTVVRDSQPGSQANTKKQEQQKALPSTAADNTHKDPLSFNFLYFIIQKFKISDIMDE